MGEEDHCPFCPFTTVVSILRFAKSADLTLARKLVVQMRSRGNVAELGGAFSRIMGIYRRG